MFFKRTPKYDGLIGFYGLSEWWHESLTKEEQETVLEKYSRYPTQHLLLEGQVDERTQTARAFLAHLAPWFSTENPAISAKMMEMALKLIEPDLPLDRRVLFLDLCIELFYKDKDSPNRMPRLEHVAKALIDKLPDYNDLIAKLSSRASINSQGLRLLVAVFKSEGKYLEAAEIAKQAQAKNWPGEWEHELEIIAKKAVSK